MASQKSLEELNDEEKQKMTNAILERLKQQASGQAMLADAANGGVADAGSSEREKKHAFWDTQPMPHGERTDHPEGPIVPNKEREQIRAEPYNMPSGFEWSTVDICKEEERLELYNLLANNYVEDDDCLFRFDYSQAFLLWALTPPGFRTDFLLGVRTTKGNKLVAFISAVPAHVHVYQHTPQLPVVEINFLCVHKKLRAKRLAPVLIKEITRRVNLTGVFQAVYTAGVVLPVPVASARYHHRSLNPKKLVRVGFSRLSPRLTMARMQKLYKLPATPVHALIQMQPQHVPGVHRLLTNYLEKFPLHIQFTEEEVAHWLLPRPTVVQSYVICNADGDVTDLCSFYHLPSTILSRDDGDKPHETLYAAYSYYNVATTIPLVELMRDALILANSGGSDVFNALNLMENDQFLTELKFGKGDGNLQYYIYNWSCPSMNPSDVGIVLL